MLQGKMPGLSFQVQTGRIGCHEGKGKLDTLVFNKMEKDPAYKVYIRAVTPNKILNTPLMGLDQIAKYPV